MPPVAKLAIGYDHVLALTLRNNGTIVAWGNNSAGQASVPPGLAFITTVAAGYRSSFAINGNTSGGQLLSWGASYGPALANVTDIDTIVAGSYLADPALTLFSGSTSVGGNDDWAGDTQVSLVGGSVAAFPFASATSKDAALYNSAMLPATYSIQIAGVGGATGNALAEIYDATALGAFKLDTPRLINVSARARVGTGDDFLIAGFVVSGSTSKTVLIRAVGPSLAQFGLGGVLGDPRVALLSGTTLVASNDNWGAGTALTNAFNQVGAFPLADTSRDSALLVAVQPGAYTVQLSGVNGATGIALVEIYEVP